MSEQPGFKYAFLSLTKVLAADNKTKIRQWRDVLAAMEAGDLLVGSRTPVAGIPGWVTPEVIRGGFATTAFAAGGDLRPHEISLAKKLSLPMSDTSRLRWALNNWYLSDEGLATLHDQAQSGNFAVRAPEETALLIVSLLLETAPDAVDGILAEIMPFFDRLRFYPAPHENVGGEGVFVRNVGQVRDQLKTKQPRAELVLQHNSLTIWIPLYDRLIDLLAAPEQPQWKDQAAAWLADYERAVHEPTARRWSKSNSPFQRCRQALIQMYAGKLVLQSTLHDVNTIIARHRTKYGGSKARTAFRRIQAEQDVTVWHDAVADVVTKRLETLPFDAGISDPARVAGPITQAEAVQGAPKGCPLARSFVHTINSARMAPVSELVETGQISAPEVLADVLPQLTAEIYANGLPTKAETRVCAKLYKAFSQRRSLLLVDLQSQIRLEELPWAAALLERRNSSHDHQVIARKTLIELVRMSLTHFPHVIFPNRLIREMANLAKIAELKIPFTAEIAADIFMGQFLPHFSEAADISLVHYAGTLYARYYNLPTHANFQSLGEFCNQRARLRSTHNWSVAAKGMIIEQQQIITSHNLGQLLTAFDLSSLKYAQMVTDCFDWICKRQQIPLRNWRAKLQMTKNTAYAWRQMIAFMSELPAAEQRAVFEELKDTAAAQSTDYQERISPALDGLGRAISGETLVETDIVFLGWVRGKHPFSP